MSECTFHHACVLVFYSPPPSPPMTPSRLIGPIFDPLLRRRSSTLESSILHALVFVCLGGAGRERQQLHHHHRAQADEARARDSGREETAPLTFVVHSKNGRGRVGAADIFSSVACNGTVLPSSLLAVTENKKRADPLMSHPYVTLYSVSKAPFSQHHE